jgi:ankyrin repeat protein
LLLRFRWVVCQIEALRGSLPRHVLENLRKLPKSLDDTYERILREIDQSNKKDVYCLLQCLVVSARPLYVEELAEVLAVDFDSGEEIPKLNPDWRWEDDEEALQAACSSLIAIVDIDGSRVVQFSHFSVQEYLTSPRLAESSGDVSCYYISPGPAHATLAKACIGVLCRLGDGITWYSTRTWSPLTEYAAQHWVGHAQFEDVSSSIQKGMEELFDPDKPHFAAWVRLHDMDKSDKRPDHELSITYFLHQAEQRDAPPLYYAALCGFLDVARYLIVRHPQQTNSLGGICGVPLLAALLWRNFQMAELLYQHGADLEVRGHTSKTPLLWASSHGFVHIVKWLLGHGAYLNARTDDGWNSLHCANYRCHFGVARVLLAHNIDVEVQTNDGLTPSRLALKHKKVDLVQLLLGGRVNVNVRNNYDMTPLHYASMRGDLEFTRVLLERGADVEAKDDQDCTALDMAIMFGNGDIVKLLSEYGTK